MTRFLTAADSFLTGEMHFSIGCCQIDNGLRKSVGYQIPRWFIRKMASKSGGVRST